VNIKALKGHSQAIECVAMNNLFSSVWAKRFIEAWNGESELAGDLGKIAFSSTVAFGFLNEDNPRLCLRIENGKVTGMESCAYLKPDWDVRADHDQWREWVKNPPGLMAIGMAYTGRSLQFRAGDYVAMVKNPAMATPFVKCIEVMSRISS
jgi:hypothetical protein